jgi:hypothetical protein
LQMRFDPRLVLQAQSPRAEKRNAQAMPIATASPCTSLAPS